MLLHGDGGGGGGGGDVGGTGVETMGDDFRGSSCLARDPQKSLVDRLKVGVSPGPFLANCKVLFSQETKAIGKKNTFLLVNYLLLRFIISERQRE